jgi:undecaprenyl-diphosphatase
MRFSKIRILLKKNAKYVLLERTNNLFKNLVISILLYIFICTNIKDMKKIILIWLFFLPISLFSQNLDYRILHSINSPEPLPSDGFYRFISNSDVYVMGGVPTTMVIIGLVNHDNTMLRNAGEVSISSVLNFGVTTALKYTINRERPFQKYRFRHTYKTPRSYRDYPGIIVNKTFKNITDPSFPSGHTSTAFTIATSLSLSYSKWYIIIPSYLYAGTVAYSRMDLGAHYPSDVLGGVIIGTGSSYLTYKLLKKY